MSEKTGTRDQGRESSANPWIDVSLDLPDGPSTVLVGWEPDMIALQQPDDSVWLGYHDSEVWRSMDHEQFAPQPSHWMDLPKPPERRNP